jgi:2-(1,2-epoxy-1,2-dihydrophenyl)acetyl-CoA isomerase
MTYETILTAREGDVFTITLNKPERLNAMAALMADEVNAALDQLDGARAVLITGTGRAFCSGADLQARGEAAITGGMASYMALTQHYNPLMMKIARLPVPVVTAVNGPAAGIGCSVALAGDFAIAGKSAYFLQAFVNIGLVPDGGSSWMLPRLIGKARATEMMLLGEKISGEKAESWGLIHKCVDDAALMDEARALATRLASGPTVAIGIMRQNIAAALEADYASALLREAEGQRIAGSSADAMEGGLSFLQKRKPAFQGR